MIITETWHTLSSDIQLRRSAPRATQSLMHLDLTETILLTALTVGWQSFTVQTLSPFQPTTFEQLISCLKTSLHNFVYIVVYRPSSQPVTSKFIEEFSSLLETIAIYSSTIVITGDFNLHLDDSDAPHVTNFIQLLDAFNLLRRHDLDPDSAKSYRPISNLTYISKLIERLVSHRLTSYLSDHNLLPTVQSAYRQNHSTETASLKIVSDVLDAADTGHVTPLALLDLSAAFDTVDHNILLSRLECSYGFSGTKLKWIASFLKNRSQIVVFAGIKSAPTSLLYGVPQG